MECSRSSGKQSRDETIAVATTAKPGKSHDEDAAVIDEDSLYLLWSDRFYPIDFDHWAPVRTSLILPAGFKTVAPGHVMRSETVDGAQKLLFETTQPTVCYSVFADRRWSRNERVVNGLKIITLLHPEQDKYADKILAGCGDVLKFFTDLHGYYPGEQFSFVTVAGMRGRLALNGYIAYWPTFLDREMERTGYDAHETSLLWWATPLVARGQSRSNGPRGSAIMSNFFMAKGERNRCRRCFSGFEVNTWQHQRIRSRCIRSCVATLRRSLCMGSIRG
jgi:hypothetical protein